MPTKEYVKSLINRIYQLKSESQFLGEMLHEKELFIDEIKNELQATNQWIGELERENESLNDWKRIITNAPGESQEVAINRFKFTASIKPIIDEWRKEVEKRDEAIKKLVEALTDGTKWMKWWLDQEICDCDEYGHHCGKTERRAELKMMNEALKLAGGTK
jgi:hypothetical protein